jgi:hypothetical protein
MAGLYGQRIGEVMMPPSPDDGPADHYVIDVANQLALPPDQWGPDVKEIVRQAYGLGWSPRGAAARVHSYLTPVDGGEKHADVP